MWIREFLVFLVMLGCFEKLRCYGQINELSTWSGVRQIDATTPRNTWSLHTRIPMSSSSLRKSDVDLDYTDYNEERKKEGGFKVKKKYRKYLLPLLMAYKLKFFALIPVLIGGLLLLTGTTGLAGFFFALFAATMAINKGH